MAKKKKPKIFPDTASYASDQPHGASHGTENPSLAESAEEFDQNSSENGTIISLLVAPRVHPVLFEVSKDGNAVTFATNLIKNLKRVDHHARLIPKPDASAGAVPLTDVSDIPNDESAKDFVCDYFDDLHVTSKLLKGKFWVQCKAKFPTFKKNKTFFKWLAGSKSEPKITLVRTELQGPKRFLTGFFFNVVARYDLSGHFTEQMTHMFRDNTRTGQQAPGQEVEPFIMFRNGTTTKVYAMYSSTKKTRIF